MECGVGDCGGVLYDGFVCAAGDQDLQAGRAGFVLWDVEFVFDRRVVVVWVRNGGAGAGGGYYEFGDGGVDCDCDGDEGVYGEKGFWEGGNGGCGRQSQAVQKKC